MFNIKNSIIIFILLIITTSTILFYDYLFFNKLYVFTDAGDDTLRSALPNYAYLIDTIKNGSFRFWSFEDGVGNSRFTLQEMNFDPFNILILLFNKYTVVYFLGYLAVIKILLSGIFFYFYLSKLNINNYAKIIGSLLYAFNGYTIVWGTAEFDFVTMVVFLPLGLYALECSLSNNKWVFFTLYIAFINIFSVYLSFMISIFIIIFSLFRYI